MRGVIASVAATVVVLALFFLWLHSATTTRRVDAGYYGVVIHYSTNGAKDIKVYPGGFQYTIEWGSNVRDFEYPISVQTIKIYQSTREGIAPYPDAIGCNDINGLSFSGDLLAHFTVTPGNLYNLYTQHPDVQLNGAVDDSIAGLVVRPALQGAWKAACSTRTYTQFRQQEFGSVESDILRYAQAKLVGTGITLIDVGPQTIYLPSSLQDAINNVAKAQANLQASQIAIQTAKNESAALEEYNREIQKNPALLKLLLLEKVLERWDGHGIIPNQINNP